MAFKFPFTNYHELNLTWVLEQLKKLFEESNENVETIESYEDRLSAVETELPTVEATAEQAATVANAAATLAQTAKSTADTANENALTASAQAGLARQEAATAEAEAQAATQAATQAQATAQNFDGRITQAEENASEALQEAQSFENRVDAAINTANNAANTATIAQGIAVNANQNAATALDTAQTADSKAEAAQDAADLADGKAEAAQDAADIADEKAEAAQDAAEVADGKATQNAVNIGNLADLTTVAKENLVAAINEAAQSGGGSSLAVVTLTSRHPQFNTDVEEPASVVLKTGFISGGLNSTLFERYNINLFKPSIWIQGYDLTDTGQTSSAVNTHWVTDYIDVSEYNSLYMRLLYTWGSAYRTRVCGYNSEKVFTSLIFSHAANNRNSINTLNVSNCKYIRVSAACGDAPGVASSKVFILSPAISRTTINTSGFYGGEINLQTGKVINKYNSSGEAITPEEIATFTPVEYTTSPFNGMFFSMNYTTIYGITVQYKESMQKYVDDKIAELQALILEN